jgi:16S rRNA G966 N2-methylase RsmD
LGRKCLIYDIEPARKDIARHDISTGFPKEAQGCDLILLDPPYWRQKRGKYPKGEDSFSEVDLDGFNRKMEKLIRDCFKTVKSGGHVALLIQNTTEFVREERDVHWFIDSTFPHPPFHQETNEPMDVPMLPHPFFGHFRVAPLRRSSVAQLRRSLTV